MLFSLTLNAKEYKNLKQFTKHTGKTELPTTDWLTKDRKNNNSRWQAACKFNISQDTGSVEYTTISQRRDFYKWVYDASRAKGHEVVAPALAYVVTDIYSKIDKSFNRLFVPEWFVNFAYNGTERALKGQFKLLQELMQMDEPLKGEAAAAYDTNYLKQEQCITLDDVFNNLTEKQQKKLLKIGGGKGIYNLFVKNELEYNQPTLTNCQDRINYGEYVIKPYVKELFK